MNALTELIIGTFLLGWGVFIVWLAYLFLWASRVYEGSLLPWRRRMPPGRPVDWREP